MIHQDIRCKLQSAWAIQKTIDADIDKIASLESMAEKITPAYSLAPAAGGANVSKVEAGVVGIISIKKDIAAQVTELKKAMAEVEALVYTVKEPELRMVLLYRYINFWSWEQIAVKLNYSYRHILRLHGDALNMLEENKN